jgi:hypothetical protein
LVGGASSGPQVPARPDGRLVGAAADRLFRADRFRSPGIFPDFRSSRATAPEYVPSSNAIRAWVRAIVEQTTKLELVVNIKTARAPGFEMPISLLVRTDELVE